MEMSDTAATQRKPKTKHQIQCEKI